MNQCGGYVYCMHIERKTQDNYIIINTATYVHFSQGQQN